MDKAIFKPGQEVEGYRIEESIGQGGMAELFLAKDLVLTNRVVIKVLNLPFCRAEAFRKQFLREARIQANLDSPHIVRVFRAFDYQDYPCLVIQYVEGTDLERVIRNAKSHKDRRGEKGALSLERSIHIFLQILEGMGFVHKYRIIHGDIKPSNVLIDMQGRARIADFGLSFLLPHKQVETERGAPRGTPYYMSPEQMLDEEIDFRSDIYSLGVTLFYMLTGEHPAGDKKRIIEILESHLEGSLERPKSILDEFKEVRPRIREAILKALENDPNIRHQSCLEFALAVKDKAPYEMYSELLRLCLLTKKSITPAERNHLDKIALMKGLMPEEAVSLENSIRNELHLPHLDFNREYEDAYRELHSKGMEDEGTRFKELEETYVSRSRLLEVEAKVIRDGIEEDT
jgi:serine/threonine protein kinase